MKKETFYKEIIPDTPGPLEGIRMLEATTAGAGPWCGTFLADMGAEVTKIEMPRMGDMSRYSPDPKVDLRTLVNKPDLSDLEGGMLHQSINRNKKGITLDLRKPQGQEIFKGIGRHMDVILENFRPGVMDGWGLGYDDVVKVKPDIIYTSVSGYGQYGPYSYKPGYDPIGQAMSGLMSISGFPDGPPTKTGNAMADNITGWQGAMGTMAALLYRYRTGKGQHVDACLLDACLYTTSHGIMAASNGYVQDRTGNRYANRTVANVFHCQDGHVFICAVIDSHWARLCRAMGREELIDNPRAASMSLRSQNNEWIEGIVTTWMEGLTVDQALGALDEAGIVSAPIYDFAQVVSDDHIREREMISEVEHPHLGQLNLYGVAPKLSRTPGKVRSPAPLLGQHNKEVYGNYLGYTTPKLEELQEEGII
jgi:crotonobetainyl-CoA:carnitine CoA-transferase CaiB-like acyl-CoA transferase